MNSGCYLGGPGKCRYRETLADRAPDVPPGCLPMSQLRGCACETEEDRWKCELLLLHGGLEPKKLRGF